MIATGEEGLMNGKISEIAARIAELEQQLEEALTEEREKRTRSALYD